MRLTAGQRDTIARLALQRAFEPADENIGRLVLEVGAEAVVDTLGAAGRSRFTTAQRRRWDRGDAVAQALDELSEIHSRGMHVVTPMFAGWPTGLDDLEERAPLALRVRGSLGAVADTQRRVAIVGARAATRYGLWVAEQLAASLANSGHCVVSGGAFGIDAAAHRGALSANGTCVLVTAAGPDVAAPTSHELLFNDVERQGCVVSEVPMGTRPSRHRFLIRNRVIAALSDVVVVVEAADRSGSLATAREADAVGRQVLAVPGPLTSVMSNGTNALIQSGLASLVRSVSDIEECICQVANASGSDHC